MTDPTVAQQVRALMAPMVSELQRMQREIAELRAGASTGQLNNASVTGTTINVYDQDGETLRQQIGLHTDGTTGTSAMNGPTPPKPSAPVLTAGQLALTVAWDGTFLDDDGEAADRPTDLRHVEVHTSTSAAFTAGGATLQGTLAEAGTLVVQPLEVVAQYVQLVSVSTSAVSSDPSSEVAGTPLEVVATDIVDGIVTTLKLAAGAVTEAKIAADAVTETKIADDAVTTPKLVAGAVETSKIAAGAVDAGTIAAGAVTTAKLDALAVTAANIAANAVTSGKIDAGAVTAAKLETDLAVVGTIRSPDFDPGVDGWAVSDTGAEFNNVVIRGDVEIGPSNNNQILIDTSPVVGSAASIRFPTNRPDESIPAAIVSFPDFVGQPYESQTWYLQSAIMDSPATGRFVAVRLLSEGADGADKPELAIFDNVRGNICKFSDDRIYLNPHIEGGHQIIRTATAQTVLNNVTPQNDNDLFFVAEANKSYRVKFVVAFDCAAGGIHARTEWFTPAGSTGSKNCIGPTDTLASYIDNKDTRATFERNAFGTDVVYVTQAVNVDHVVIEEGIVHIGATAGNIRFRFAQGVISAVTPIRRLEDSWMEVECVT